MDELLKIRKEIKKNKPDFIKQDAHKKNRLKNNWRKPRGRHSKLRLGKRGHGKCPGVGYSSPKKVKGLNKEGLKEVIVKSVKDLENVKDEVIVISGKVGIKKKLVILEEIKKRNLKVINIKDKDQLIKKIQDKKAERLKKKGKKEEKKEEKPKRKEEKTKEEKEKEEKEIKRKVLEGKT